MESRCQRVYRLKKLARKFYHLITVFFFKAVQLLPFETAVRTGGFLGGLAYHLVGKARAVAEENLRLSYPDKSEAEIRDIAKAVFVNQGKNAFELFQFPKLSSERLKALSRVVNEEGYRKAGARGRGVIMASAHCGNWEVLGAALSARGFVINSIAKRVYIEALNDLLLSLRSSVGLKIIFRSDRDSAKKMIKALRSGETLAMLIDQDTQVPGVFVDFFGRQAWTPSGLAAIALKTGAPVIVALDARQPDGTHEISITGPLELVQTGDHGRDVLENTAMITKKIEEHIRKNASQWVWMHERWKTPCVAQSTGQIPAERS